MSQVVLEIWKKNKAHAVSFYSFFFIPQYVKKKKQIKTVRKEKAPYLLVLSLVYSLSSSFSSFPAQMKQMSFFIVKLNHLSDFSLWEEKWSVVTIINWHSHIWLKLVGKESLSLTPSTELMMEMSYSRSYLVLTILDRAGSEVASLFWPAHSIWLVPLLTGNATADKDRIYQRTAKHTHAHTHMW